MGLAAEASGSCTCSARRLVLVAMSCSRAWWRLPRLKLAASLHLPRMRGKCRLAASFRRGSRHQAREQLMATSTRRRALHVQEPLASAARPILRPVPKRVLLVSPQPFFEDRGTPIAVLQVAQALCQAGYAVDLLSYPVGRPVEVDGMRILRAPNPLRIRRVPVGLSLRKLLLDATLFPMLFW